MKQKSQAFAASSDSKCLVLICAPQGRPRFYFYFAQRSFTTSPAIISPTTDGTNATLPGISLLSVHLCSAPGGHYLFLLLTMAVNIRSSSIQFSRYKKIPAGYRQGISFMYRVHLSLMNLAPPWYTDYKSTVKCRLKYCRAFTLFGILTQ